MATYYASPTGSGTACTLGSPCSLVTGKNKLTPGDTLQLRAGTYVGSANLGAIPSGTSWASPVTIMAYPSETVTITPTSNEIAIYFNNGNHYIIIDRLVINGTGGLNGIKVMQGSHHIRIQNCEVKNTPVSGIQVSEDVGSTDNEFINCSVHNNGFSGQFDHGFYISNGNTLIDGCEIYDNSGYGIHMFSGANNNNNIFRNNRIHGQTNKAGILISAGSGHKVYNNVIYGNDWGVSLFYNGGSAGVYNNTMYSNGVGIYACCNTGSSTCSNNICYGGTIGIYIEDATVGVITLRNNLSSTNSNSNYLSTPNTPVLSGNLFGNQYNPQFVDAPGHDFDILTNSAAKDVGLDLSAQGFNTDIVGTHRPFGPAWDIGAYEFTTASVWYARTDGGTTAQCTGRANAAYSGFGIGQACAYASLEDAVNAAAAENVAATVIARAGDTWSQFTLPARAASTAYITVQSSGIDNIAPQLHGVTNADVGNMATIALSQSDTFALIIPTGRAYWQFRGMEITTANRDHYYTILVDHAGDHVNFDSCWIHSLEDYTDNPEASCRIGMSYRGSNSTITNCRLAYFSAYVLNTQIVDNNFGIAYAGSTLAVSNTSLGAWYENFISGGSAFAPAVEGVTISGTPTMSTATVSSVSGLSIGDLIALRNYPLRTLTNACSFVAATKTLTCVGGDFTAAYRDLGGAGTPSFIFPNLGVSTGIASVINSTTAITESDLGGSNFSNQTVNIEGVYGAAKVTNIVGNVLTYTPWGITALQAPPEVPGNVQWGGFVPNNLSFTQCSFYNNPVIAGIVRTQVGSSPKGFWEIKAVDTLDITGCEFTGYGANMGYLVVNQGTTGGCPSVWTTVTNVNFANNYYHVDTNPYQIMAFALQDNYYCTSEGGGNITVENNLFTSGAVFSYVNSGSDVSFRHNTVINDDNGGVQLIYQQASNSAGDTLGFVYSDNIAYNNFYGMACAYGPALGCLPGHVISTNIFIGTYTTDPWCQHGFSPGNVCVVDQAAVKFLDAATNNYRLAADSPGKGTGTGGTDMGVNWATLVAALGFDPSGGSVAVAVSGQVVISGNVTI